MGVQVVSECNAALSWLEQKQALQAGLRKTDDPVLLAADIKKKTETLSRVCHPLMSRPAPPPPVSRLWLCMHAWSLLVSHVADPSDVLSLFDHGSGAWLLPGRARAGSIHAGDPADALPVKADGRHDNDPSCGVACAAPSVSWLMCDAD